MVLSSFYAVGFLRYKDGTITTFGFPGNSFTHPISINPKGEITGYYQGTSGGQGAFLRDKDGTFTTFGVPGGLSTSPTSINPSGEITGFYMDANSKGHGFLRKPDHNEGSKDEKDDEGGEDSE